VGHGGFRKKNSYKKSEPNTAGEFFKGVAFSVWPHGPGLYLKTKEHLGLHLSTQFKNEYINEDRKGTTMDSMQLVYGNSFSM